jgi:sulfopyruvate decarboxylase alpha subunit
MIAAKEFVGLLLDEGFDFFTGVPCSLVKGVIAELERLGNYIPETREDAAVGLATGAHLAGKKPVVIMQNSGLGVCLNALASLSLPYSIPCLLLVTWRGYQGKDAPEHLIMGEASPSLMEAIHLPYQVLAPNKVKESLRWASDTLRTEHLPAALLLPPGVTV